MRLVVTTSGVVRCLYSEVIDLSSLGSPAIRRASHVEPGPDGRWRADLRPVQGPVLGPFDSRSEALEAERAWIEEHWLVGSSGEVAPLSPASP
ncbi:hypothetical protein [Paludisphaera borealis]|uniref:Uncharacterized protein n=1 Tax=Paludisphaera borealis TaxID=1387353 RepID=A0A1U7CW93_9BACT|nr:hypothetical protein [Paludisphaera borealis]APW63217.1 hypothetical protein BSF38_04781 [Paludisphaera borealis]